MKIKDLIALLQSAPDNEKEVFVESINNYWNTNLDFDFDDNNDLRLYETDETEYKFTLQKIKELENDFLKNNKIEQIKKSISQELDKIATIEIDYE